MKKINEFKYAAKIASCMADYEKCESIMGKGLVNMRYNQIKEKAAFDLLNGKIGEDFYLRNFTNELEELIERRKKMFAES